MNMWQEGRVLPNEWYSYYMQWDLGSYPYKLMDWTGFTKVLTIWLGLVEWVGFELEEKEILIGGSGMNE